LCLPSVLRAGLGGGTGRNRRSQIIRLFNRLRTHNQIFQILEVVRRVHKTPIWSFRSVFEILFDISTQCF
jgi:hypothetical protein